MHQDKYMSLSNYTVTHNENIEMYIDLIKSGKKKGRQTVLFISSPKDNYAPF